MDVSVLADDIRLGRLSAWLVRPAPLLYQHLANNLAEKLVKAAALVPLVVVVSLAFSGSIQLPESAARWALFGLGMLFGAVLVFLVDILIGSLAFWFNDITSLVWARTVLSNFLSGAVVPLALMPTWAHDAVNAQPYRFMVSFPVEIVVGNLTATDVAYGFMLQLLYIAAIGYAARLVWRAGLRAYTSVGA